MDVPPQSKKAIARVSVLMHGLAWSRLERSLNAGITNLHLMRVVDWIIFESFWLGLVKEYFRFGIHQTKIFHC